jgi:ribosomal protein S18 acetylase RimI-like enzyme
MELSPISRKDFKEIKALIHTSSDDLDFVEEGGLETQTFGDPEHDISYLIKASEKGKIVAALIGSTRKDGQAKVGYIKYFGVLPKSRLKGVGKAVFSELERRFQKRDVREIRIGACPPPYMQNGVGVHDTGTVTFLLKRGYHISDTIIDLTCDLMKWKPEEKPEDKALIKSAKVRQAKAADEKALIEMVTATFPFWVYEVKQGLEKGAVFVADNNGVLAAFCCANAANPGFYGPTGSLESARGLGLGRILLNKTMEYLKKDGHKKARIPWVGPIPFYVKCAQAKMGPIYFQFNKKI